MHIHKYIPIIFLTLLACSQSHSNILPKEKMEQILWDVAQGSEYLNGFIYPKHPEQNRALTNNTVLEKIFKSHKISKKQFETTLEYYKKRPNDLKEILDSVIAKKQRITESDSSGTHMPPHHEFPDAKSIP